MRRLPEALRELRRLSCADATERAVPSDRARALQSIVRVGGRLGLFFSVVQRRATNRRCQHGIVPGGTSIPTRRVRGSRNAGAAIIAR